MTDEMPPEAVIWLQEREAIPSEVLTICPDCGIDAWRFEEDGRFVHEVYGWGMAVAS